VGWLLDRELSALTTAPRAGDDELRAMSRFRWAGELSSVFAGDRTRDSGTGNLLPWPLISAAGPIPDAVAKSLATRLPYGSGDGEGAYL
jgi:hypothetical protein